MTLTISALGQTYLDHLRVERGLSVHTIAAYRRDLARYVDHLVGLGVDDPATITTTMINNYAMELRSAGLAPASLARAIVAIRSLHRFALDEGVIHDDPAHAVQPPHPPQRLPKALRLDQVQAMLAAPDPTTELGVRDIALLELLYGTGARVSEVTGLDVDDVVRLIDVPVGQPSPGLRLLGKGNKQRMVPLGSYARSALTAYLVRARPALSTRGKATPALFLNSRGGRLSRQSVWTVISSVAAQALITEDVSPHTLRHSFATHLLDGGADVRVVQELLGHASVTTTQIYTLVTVDQLREVYLASHPRAR